MVINGLQKLTLLDFPGRTACTVFTGGCDFRCPFCQNGSLVLRPESQPSMPEEEFFAYLEKRRGLLDGVCVTGGEPTLRPDLLDFLKKIRDKGYAVKLDTNGSRPDVLRAAIEGGLAGFAAMDIKTSLPRYPEVCGVPGYDTAPVRESAALLMEGRIPFEFRTTVVRELHRAEDFESIGEWLAGAPRYFLQQFRDSGDLVVPGFTAYSLSELTGFLGIVRRRIPSAELRGVG